jgi:octaprenyl-diphosphate synthase
MDDILDYDPLNATGKTAGNDLAEGKITLPLIYILKNGHPEEIKMVEIAIQEGGYQHFSVIHEILKTQGAIEYTKAFAKTEAMKAKTALHSLKQSPYTEAAMALADFAVARYY